MSSSNAFRSGDSSVGDSSDSGDPSSPRDFPRKGDHPASSQAELEHAQLEQAHSEETQSEQDRLRALRRYGVVGTEPEPSFDRITRMAAALFEVPIALINFVGEDRRWYKSTVGVESGGGSPEPSFCREAIQSSGTAVIEDVSRAERFAEHPLAEGEPGVRFYAGAPLETPGGYRIGTLCVLDEAPRTFSEEAASRLEDLAKMVMNELERRWETKGRIRKKENRLRSIAENVSEGIYRSTPDGNLIEANQAFAKMFGYASAEEVLGVDPSGLYADPDEREEVLERTDRRGGLNEEEVEFRRADGSTFTGRVTDTVIRDKEGEVSYYDGVIIDVTQRRRQEEELEKSRRELRREKRRVQSITENVSDGIYRSTEEDGIVYANSAFIQMFGYRDLRELRAAGPEALYVNPGRREELIEKENRNGQLRHEEVRYRRKDGSTFVALLSSQQVEGEEEGKTYFDGAITDITERKRHEEKLGRRQRHIEALYGATGRLLEAEDRGEVPGLLAAIVDEALGHPVTAIRLAEGGRLKPAHVSRAAEDRMLERPTYDVEGGAPAAQAYRAGETRVYDDLSAEAEELNLGGIRAAAYVPIGSYGLISVGTPEAGGIGAFDRRLMEVLGAYAALVLGRLRREEKLLKAREEAETARREAEKSRREAEKSRREAETARREAEAASQAKSAFLANMSHEIRTPLTSMIGFAEAIGAQAEELCLPEENPLPKHAELIKKGGKRLLETLDGVLNLSELEAGQMELSVEPVDLAVQAGKVAEELRPEAEEKGLELNVDAREAWARADEGGVQIILQNLLSNAIKYTEEGSVEVRVRRESGRAAIEVEDTGIGMEPSVAEDLFEPFRQASEGISREYEGTGIGLAVTKKATEEMGGSIEVDTQEGEGSCFTAWLPLGEDGENGGKGSGREVSSGEVSGDEVSSGEGSTGEGKSGENGRLGRG